VEALLAQAREHQRQSRWAEAKAALTQAASRLGGGGPADLAERLRLAQADLDWATRLDAIRLKRAAWNSNQFDAAAAAEYPQVFVRAGLAIVGRPAETVARLNNSAIREVWVAALDDWALAANNPGQRERLLRVARQTDPNPWRDRVRDPRVWEDRAALERLAQEAPADGASPQLLTVLGAQLLAKGGDPVPFLQAAQQRHPTDFWLNYELGSILGTRGRAHMAEAVGFFRAALVVRPDAAVVHYNLGVALMATGRQEEAIAHFQHTLRGNPRNAEAHNSLGLALEAAGRPEEAIASYQRVLRLGPSHVRARLNLAHSLAETGRWPEAIDHYRRALRDGPPFAQAHFNLAAALAHQGAWCEAIDHYRLGFWAAARQHTRGVNAQEARSRQGLLLGIPGGARAAEIDYYHRALASNPQDFWAHYHLGDALRAQGRAEEAVDHYRRALQIDARSAPAHTRLAGALAAQGRLDEAIYHYQSALQISPRHVQVHCDLGLALSGQGRFQEAIGHYQKALQIAPRHAEAYYHLGNALRAQGRLEEACDRFRKAVNLGPKYALAHCGLGLALRDLGRLAEARESLQRGHELGQKVGAWKSESGRWLEETEQLIALSQKLPAALRGEQPPGGPSEQVALADLCRRPFQRRYAAAARFYAAAFVAEPKLADNLGDRHRFHAACAAALAGGGQGRDAEPLAEAERTHWRNQALAWLRADLAAWARRLESGRPTGPRCNVRCGSGRRIRT
jgi:tetratricopeptide (TPR) repeat protein